MNRPEGIRDRIANIREIEAIVSALRALAVAHQVEARAHLEAIRAHEETVAAALSCALGMLADRPAPATAPAAELTIVVGVTQGFCGAFGDRLASAAIEIAAQGSSLAVVGGRTADMIGERGTTPVWSKEMAAHAPEVPVLASALSDDLFEALARTPGTSVSMLFSDPATIDQPPIRRSLFPVDFSRFPQQPGFLPRTTLSASALIAALVEEYVFSEVCEALMLGFAAENAARAAAMSRAQSNVKRMSADLQASFQRARQEQLTTEIMELASAAALA